MLLTRDEVVYLYKAPENIPFSFRDFMLIKKVDSTCSACCLDAFCRGVYQEYPMIACGIKAHPQTGYYVFKRADDTIGE